MMSVKIDAKKTVVLFIAIHLMIAWVAERKSAGTEQRSFLTRSTILANKANKMDKEYEITAMQP